MRNNRCQIAFASLVIVFLTLTTTSFAQYQETVLYQFNYLTGSFPTGITFDANGNIIGTTATGGHTGTCVGCGTVFELSPGSGGDWTDTTVHTFNETEGTNPIGFASDNTGNLFGSSTSTIFELSPTSGGGYAFQTLFKFSGQSDGFYPTGLTLDASGNIYGVAVNGGGVCSCGNVFELSSPAIHGGSWTLTILYIFTGGVDGGNPAGLVFDAAGNLYGFADSGGDTSSYFCGLFLGCGTVFELSPTAGGGWLYQVLFTFHQSTGSFPTGVPVFDGAGNLYGDAHYGGRSCVSDPHRGCGTVFQLSPSSEGEWNFQLMHTFTGKYDGAQPIGQPAVDALGNLYDTAFLGGSTGCGLSFGCGTLFKISPIAGGGWQFVRLWAFPGQPNGGASPIGNLIFDPAGNLYGSTGVGGHRRNQAECNYGCGVIYEVSSSAARKEK
jgi:hypothetical protein